MFLLTGVATVVFQEATEEELERLLDKIMVLFRFIHGELLPRGIIVAYILLHILWNIL